MKPQSTTAPFIDRWPRWILILWVLVLGLFVLGMLAKKTVWEGVFHLEENEAESSPLLNIEPPLIGALRLNVSAALLENHWATYQISLLDQAGTPMIEMLKESWSETGSWSEGGESGTWSESDTNLDWDTRLNSAENLVVQVAVLETTDSNGSEADFEVPIQVRLESGVVDSDFLWIALVFIGVLWVIAYYAAGHGGIPVIVEKNNDSEVSGRAVLGGPKSLVCMRLAIKADETTPGCLEVCYTIRDSKGEIACQRNEDIPASYVRDDGEIDSAYANFRRYLVLPKRQSYGFFVEVTPDNPVESLKLIVTDHATARSVEPVEHIELWEPETKEVTS